MPLYLLYLPADALDDGPTICLSKMLLKIECPGCGMTRAAIHALHFDFIAAWHFNKMFVIILPILGFYYCKELLRNYLVIKEKK